MADMRFWGCVMGVVFTVGCNDGTLSGDSDAGGDDTGATRGTEQRDAGPVEAGDPDAGDASVDPCEGVNCGNGSCVMRFGAPTCECAPHFIGDACDSCATGYTGATCDQCEDGYEPDVQDVRACVPEACAGDPCGENGTCTATPLGASCECDRGFAGKDCGACAEGYAGDDCDECDTDYAFESGRCIPAACVGVGCSGYGTCEANGSVGSCACDAGHEGSDCSECADGYSKNPTNGACEFDLCDGVDCGAGECRARGETAVCLCDEGYTGDDCSQCEEGYFRGNRAGSRCANQLPLKDDLHTWLDASLLSTIELANDGTIANWRSRAPAEKDFHRAFSKADDHHPRHVYEPVVDPNGNAPLSHRVVFDGDDILWSQISAGWDAYTIIVVAEWEPEEGNQTLMGTAVYEDGVPPKFGLLIEPLNENTVSYVHRSPVGNTGGDIAVGTMFSQPGPAQIVVAERGPLFNGTAQSIASGDEAVSVEANDGEWVEPQWIYLGGRAEHPNHWSSGLHGALREVLIYTRALSAKEESDVQAYLRVKWGL